MSLPLSEKLLDAIHEARVMNRDEGKKPAVVLLHPFVLDPWLEEIGVEWPEPTDDFDPAPEVAGLRIIRDETIPVDEVCVLSDEDYLEHEMLRREAGDA